MSCPFRRITCWVYEPLGLWLVPTISFLFDWQAGRLPTPGHYAARSCIEAVFIPFWMLVWMVFSFFFLGGGWI